MLIKTIDINQLNELEQACFDHPYSINVLMGLIKTHECYLISINNITVGYLIMLKIDDGYELIKLGIIEQFRKQNYAQQALLSFINQHQANIFLEVSATNLPAIKLYESLGFKVINIRKHYYQDNNDCLVMFHEFKHK